MTPNQLLDCVKERFVPLLHNEPLSLNALLCQALTTYQELAGVVAIHNYIEPAEKYLLPPHCLTRIGVCDKDSDFVSSEIQQPTDEIKLMLTGHERWPLTLRYLVNLSSVDFDVYDIPALNVGMISDYLELLIAIPNTQRLRRIASAGKLDVSDVPIQSELLAQKALLEEKMRLNRAIVSPFSFVG